MARQVELDKLQRDAAVQWILEDPVRYIAWMPRKVFLLWQKDTGGFWLFKSSYPDRQEIALGLQAANQLYYMLVILLSLYAAWIALTGLLSRDEERARLGLLFCMALFVTIIAAFFSGQIRYHYPAMPFLFVAAAWTLLHPPWRAAR